MGMEFPSQQQLLIPLLNTVADLDGKAPPAEIYAALADRMEVSTADRQRPIAPGSPYRAWDRTVRWTKQKAALLGYIAGEPFREWELTGSGSKALSQIRPGAVITVFETEAGVALWAESSAAVRVIEDNAVRLILTSPAYPLLKKKAYANQHPEREHVDWLFGQVQEWLRPLANDGSIVLNLGDVWLPGQPAVSLYQERLMIRLCDELGLSMCQKLYWHSPSKMPGPAEWVTIKRVRVTPAVENLYWLSKTPHPFANNRNVLREYSEAMRSRIAAGGESAASRPSGYELAAGAFGKDNGGSIAHNLLSIANTASNDKYASFVKAQALPQHPARFPIGLAEWCIKLLTEEDDLVWDPYGGSLTTAAAAEKNGRRWVSNDKGLEFVLGGMGRFDGLNPRQHFSRAGLARHDEQLVGV